MKPIAYTLTLLLCGLLASLTGGCGPSSEEQLLAAEQSQVKLRSMQTRAFDTTDKDKVLRAVIATLQDMDFVIDKADETLGTITGTKFLNGVSIKMTVSVRPREKTQMLVRANAQYGVTAVETPKPYQDFFANLSKSMFLAAHQVD